MYNGGKIIAGLAIFTVLLAFPIWYSVASGKAGYVPEPKLATDAKQCIEPTQYMIDNHMKLLDDWRQQVVRENKHTYVASDGKTYEMSMEDTCFKCHSNKEEFCDQCHNYIGAKPNCWDCHVVPDATNAP